LAFRSSVLFLFFARFYPSPYIVSLGMGTTFLLPKRSSICRLLEIVKADSDFLPVPFMGYPSVSFLPSALLFFILSLGELVPPRVPAPPFLQRPFRTSASFPPATFPSYFVTSVVVVFASLLLILLMGQNYFIPTLSNFLIGWPFSWAPRDHPPGPPHEESPPST